MLSEKHPQQSMAKFRTVLAQCKAQIDVLLALAEIVKVPYVRGLEETSALGTDAEIPADAEQAQLAVAALQHARKVVEYIDAAVKESEGLDRSVLALERLMEAHDA